MGEAEVLSVVLVEAVVLAQFPPRTVPSMLIKLRSPLTMAWVRLLQLRPSMATVLPWMTGPTSLVKTNSIPSQLRMPSLLLPQHPRVAFVAPAPAAHSLHR